MDNEIEAVPPSRRANLSKGNSGIGRKHAFPSPIRYLCGPQDLRPRYPSSPMFIRPALVIRHRLRTCERYRAFRDARAICLWGSATRAFFRDISPPSRTALAPVTRRWFKYRLPLCRNEGAEVAECRLPAPPARRHERDVACNGRPSGNRGSHPPLRAFGRHPQQRVSET
jgi:hypothetical protein